MSKSINRHQSELLLNKMQENPDIARGFIKAKDKRDVIALFWKNIQKELNSAGPPVKSIFEWKKVWTDQKRYVRKKAASNKQHQRGTGGGPNRQWKLSAAEDTIYQLIGMQEAVGGIDGCKSFGLVSSNQSRSSEQENEDPCGGDSSAYIIEDDNEEAFEEDADFEMLPSTVTKKKKTKISTSEAVEKELEIQRNLCDIVAEAVVLLKRNSKEMEYCWKKIYRSLGELNATKKSELEELKRHKHVMENLRKTEIESKIEKNKKMIEIEEMRIYLQQNK